ncbi:hypothetical protein DPMN_175942 [Dreissena polymorpha]|uniref:Uncharacterized protein n=1 Tax=Dreissena polymorpha TaxID=45954 RepID=A0A9D4IHP2_DREPO|nr:hypothetical protein DPMN_175942 [Dreissena polymorpha]
MKAFHASTCVYADMPGELTGFLKHLVAVLTLVRVASAVHILLVRLMGQREPAEY